MLIVVMLYTLLRPSSCYWDVATSTRPPLHTDTTPRQSFFRWQRTEFASMQFWYPSFDWEDINQRRRLCVIAGISIDFLPLAVATLLNRRMLLTAANYLDPYMDRQNNLRIWALGRPGLHTTPWRYRVWRVHRMFPRSNNPEHQHGARGQHCPRHDVSIIISLDQIYLYYIYPQRYQYAYRGFLVGERTTLEEKLLMAGSGYEYLEHIYENYKIFYATLSRDDVVDCSKYLPKWWGKFICIKNVKHLSGIQNGAALMQGGNTIVGVGCFEIRYNEDRIFVFTDLRYYVRAIYKYGKIGVGEYYEYAYPMYSVNLGYFYDGGVNIPYIPSWQYQYDLFPLG